MEYHYKLYLIYYWEHYISSTANKLIIEAMIDDSANTSVLGYIESILHNYDLMAYKHSTWSDRMIWARKYFIKGIATLAQMNQTADGIRGYSVMNFMWNGSLAGHMTTF